MQPLSNHRRVNDPLVLITLFLSLGLSSSLAHPDAAFAADEGPPLSPQEFHEVHALIVPRPGESRWMEIDWYPSVWEARQKAAATGKPIFLMAGSGGAPAAGC
jgi:hypothetical protein